MVEHEQTHLYLEFIRIPRKKDAKKNGDGSVLSKEGPGPASLPLNNSAALIEAKLQSDSQRNSSSPVGFFDNENVKRFWAQNKHKVCGVVSLTRGILADHEKKTGYLSYCQMHILLLQHIYSLTNIRAMRVSFGGQNATELLDTRIPGFDEAEHFNVHGIVVDPYPSGGELDLYCPLLKPLMKKPGLIIVPGSPVYQDYYKNFRYEPWNYQKTDEKFLLELEKVLAFYGALVVNTIARFVNHP